MKQRRIPVIKKGVVLGDTTTTGWKAATKLLGTSAKQEYRTIGNSPNRVLCWTDK